MYPHRQLGLTLLEVLIALVILALALTAIIKTTHENIRGTAYLQQKSIATWLALNTLNKARLEFVQFPQAPEHREGEEIVLGQQLQWQGFIKPTANPHIQEVHVQVFHQPEHLLMTELMTYVNAH